MNNKVSLIIFVVFILILYVGLDNNSRLVHSPLINKKLPDFNMPILQSESFAGISTFPDDTFLLNVWASWCLECIREHQVLNLIENDQKVRLIGINYKDDEKNAKQFLSELGNPYTNIITDPKGINSIEFGAFGVPETYLIDNKSKLIIQKFIGPLDEKAFAKIINIVQ